MMYMYSFPAFDAQPQSELFNIFLLRITEQTKHPRVRWPWWEWCAGIKVSFFHIETAFQILQPFLWKHIKVSESWGFLVKA